MDGNEETKKLLISRLKQLDDDEIISRKYCPDCLRKENKLVDLTPSSGCFYCRECGFSVCD